MKTTKKIMTLLLVLLFSLPGFAQEYEYVPFVREGIKWVYSIYNSDVWNVPDPRF